MDKFNKLIQACAAADDAEHKMRCALNTKNGREAWGHDADAKKAQKEIIDTLRPMTLHEKKQLYFALKDDLQL